MSEPLPICYLNGDFVRIEDANVSILDRGFIFGDAVYEVLPAFDGKPFLLDRHVARLRRSLDSIGITEPKLGSWEALVNRLISDNGGGDMSLYIQITRGAAPRDHVIAANVQPTVVAFCSPLQNLSVRPAEAITLVDIRWGRCDIKSTSLLANVMFRQTARTAGADEAILLRDDYVTEGAASNVFVFHDNRVKSPPVSTELLAGVTRDFLIESLRGTSYEVHETQISASELHDSSEIWCTSSSRELFPILRLDGQAVGNGEAGVAFSAVRERYIAARDAVLHRDTPV